MGELRGILITPQLHAILNAVLALPQHRQLGTTTTTTGNDDLTATSCTDSPPELESEECNSTTATSTAAAAAADSIGPRSTAIISHFPRMTVDSATTILNAAVFASSSTPTTSSISTTVPTSNNRNAKDTNKPSSSIIIPALSLEGVIAAKFLIDHSVNDENNYTTEETASPQSLLHQLETALLSSALSFQSSSSRNASPLSSSNNTTTTTTAAFAKRLERLRLRSEERSYSRLTTNIQHPAAHKSADDVTVKSMTYAASVGLNMIVGPLAFGTFMYFFAGGVLDHFFFRVDTDANDDDDNGTHGGHATAAAAGAGVDVRRVIAGVISGAFMLFVEMILFVIRSHELDVSVRKKGRRAEYRANPFGYTQKSMARTYVGD